MIAQQPRNPTPEQLLPTRLACRAAGARLAGPQEWPVHAVARAPEGRFGRTFSVRGCLRLRSRDYGPRTARRSRWCCQGDGTALGGRSGEQIRLRDARGSGGRFHSRIHASSAVAFTSTSYTATALTAIEIWPGAGGPVLGLERAGVNTSSYPGPWTGGPRLASPLSMADAVIRPAADEDVDPAYAVLEACRLGPWFELTREQFREWWPTYKQIWIAEEDAIVAFASTRGEAVEVYVLPEARRRAIGSGSSRTPKPQWTDRAWKQRSGVTRRRPHRFWKLMDTCPAWRSGRCRSGSATTSRARVARGVRRPNVPPGGGAGGEGAARHRVRTGVRLRAGLVRGVEAVHARRLELRTRSWFVVEAADGSLAAAALNWKEGFVKDLVVHPAQRRRGLGRGAPPSRSGTSVGAASTASH